jgi:hypothetical protein
VLTTPNCSLLFQVILAIFVPYFYPEAKFGAKFREKFGRHVQSFGIISHVALCTTDAGSKQSHQFAVEAGYGESLSCR